MAEDKNCRPWDKPYYSVAEAAAYWCKVTDRAIRVDEKGLPERDHQNACLRTRAEWIMDAIDCGELLCGRDGGPSLQEQIARPRRTVRRTDLRQWFKDHRPQTEWPAFLFDEVERKTQSTISADAVRALQVDRDAARSELERVKANAQKLRADLEVQGFQVAAMDKQIDALNTKLKATGAPDDRSETSYLNIIAALLNCIAGEVPNVSKHPSFSSEAKLIEAIDGHFRGYGGLSQSNLSRKFPAAKRSMAAQ